MAAGSGAIRAGKAEVEIGANNGPLQKGLAKASAMFRGFKGSVVSAGAGLATALGSTLAAVTGGAVIAGAGLAVLGAGLAAGAKVFSETDKRLLTPEQVKAQEAMKTSLDGLMQSALQANAALMTELQPAISAVVDIVRVGLRAFSEWISTNNGLLQSVGEFLGGVRDALSAGDIALAGQILWDGLKVVWKTGIAALMGFVVDWKTSFEQTISDAFFSLQEMATDAWDSVVDAATAASDYLVDAFTPVIEAFGVIQEIAILAWEAIKEAIVASVDYVSGYVSEAFGWLSEVFGGVQETALSVWDTIAEAAGDAVDWISEAFTSAIGAIVDGFIWAAEQIGLLEEGTGEKLKQAQKDATAARPSRRRERDEQTTDDRQKAKEDREKARADASDAIAEQNRKALEDARLDAEQQKTELQKKLQDAKSKAVGNELPDPIDLKKMAEKTTVTGSFSAAALRGLSSSNPNKKLEEQNVAQLTELRNISKDIGSIAAAGGLAYGV